MISLLKKCRPAEPSPPKKSIFRHCIEFFTEVLLILFLDSSFVQGDADQFSDQNVLRCHKSDSLDPKEWTLIYRDVTGEKWEPFSGIYNVNMQILRIWRGVLRSTTCRSRNHSYWLTTTWWERLVSTSGSPKKRCWRRLFGGICITFQLGGYVAIPLLLVAISTLYLVRLQQLRLLRIYQQRSDPSHYATVASKFLVSRGRVCAIEIYVSFRVSSSELPHRSFMVTRGKRWLWLETGCWYANY